jgi:uncharacterized glyoxalase superfamily protein PhnB
MKFAGICLITEHVLALARFYERVFSAQAQGDDTHAEISFGGLGVAIFSREGMEQMAPGSMRGAGTGSVTLMLEVDDVDAEYERLKELGVEFVKPPQTHPWGSRSLWFRDPDGHIIDFFSRGVG